jgi:hypothetical protein
MSPYDEGKRQEPRFARGVVRLELDALKGWGRKERDVRADHARDRKQESKAREPPREVAAPTQLSLVAFDFVSRRGLLVFGESA